MIRTHLLVVKAENRPGLLHLITGQLNRKLIPILSLNAGSTDIHDIVLITLEIIISESKISSLKAKLDQIIEVIATDVMLIEETMAFRCVVAKLNKDILKSSQANALSKYSVRLLNSDNQALTFAFAASEVEVRNFCAAIDGPFLMAFVQSAPLAENLLTTQEEQSSVINRLAA